MKWKVEISSSFQENGKVSKPHKDWEVQYWLSHWGTCRNKTRKAGQIHILKVFEFLAWKVWLYSLQLRGVCQRILKFQPPPWLYITMLIWIPVFGFYAIHGLLLILPPQLLLEFSGLHPNSTSSRKASSIYMQQLYINPIIFHLHVCLVSFYIMLSVMSM